MRPAEGAFTVLHRKHLACVTLQSLLNLNPHQKVTVFSKRSKPLTFTILQIQLLILYPATLLTLCISANSFLVDSLGFSMYMIISYTNERVLFLPFQSRGLSFFFLLNFPSQNHQYNVDQKWQEETSLSCSCSQRKSFQFFTIKCDVSQGFQR